MPMQINSLLLGVAIPAAAKTLDLATSAVQSLGESFAHTLARPQLKELGAETPPVDALTLDLEGFADRFRKFLGSFGIEGPFKLRLNLSSQGEQSTNISAVDSKAVADLLAENPSWLRDLKQIASSAQVSRLSFASSQPPELHVEISDIATSHWSRL